MHVVSMADILSVAGFSVLVSGACGGCMRRALVAVMVVAVTVGVCADEQRWWSHVEALANDGMEGRNTGSPAHKRAAEYVAGGVKRAGLEPAGGNGDLQP